MTRVPILRIDPEHPEASTIHRAARVLAEGGLVAFPTETVYGLGADGLNPEAVMRIFAAKGRPSTDPLILHVLDVDGLRQVAGQLPSAAEGLCQAYWPGPLTLVVPRGKAVPRQVTAGLDTVAVRAPSHPVARALVAALGRPIAAPSANPFGRTSPTHAAHVAAGLGEHVDLILDGGASPIGVESTVVDLTSRPPQLLRAGGLTVERLRAHLPELEMAADAAGDDEAPQRSPGTSSLHYAPRARLVLVTGTRRVALEAMAAAVLRAAGAGATVGMLATRDDLDVLSAAIQEAGATMRMVELDPRSVDRASPPEDGAAGRGGAAERSGAGARADGPRAILSASLGPADEPAVAARRLYAALHALDAAGASLLVTRDPGRRELRLALRDRLRRAAHGRMVQVGDGEGAEAILRALGC